MNDDNNTYCMSGATEQELLATMMEAGFVKTGENTYEIVGMEYSVGYCDNEDEDMGIFWIAAPTDGMVWIKKESPSE